MKLLLIHEDKRSYGQGGGAETMLRDVTRALELRGHTVQWYQGDGDFAEVMATFRPDVCQVQTIHNFMGFGPVRWLQRHGWPHVWALMDYWPFCGGRMLLKNQDQESCPAVTGVCDGSCAAGPTPALYRELVNRSPVLALNAYTADIYRRNGLRCDYVVELGTDTTFFTPDPEQRTPGKIVTTCAWPQYRTKGMPVLHEALQRIGAGASPVTATLITGKPRETVRDLLQTAAIFVFPSTYEETWGLVLSEGMSTGLACIASTVSGAKAQVQDGVTGRLFANRDAGALADILCELLSDDGECQRLGANARAHMEQEHSLEAMGARLEAAYQEVIDKHG